MELKMDKFKRLIHYICHTCDDLDKLGSIKLNKILYFVDFLWYLVNGESMTQETYIKRQFGPVPKHILKALDELQKENKVLKNTVPYFGHNKMEYHSIDCPDMSIFKPEEIVLINEVVGIITNRHTANSISKLTHDHIWDAAEIGEEIPYFTIFASEVEELDENDIDWALSKIKSVA